jgi:hypothetical protein
MAHKKGNPVDLRLKRYRETLADIRRLFPDIPVTPAIFDGQDDDIRTLTGHPSLRRAAEFFNLELSAGPQRQLLLEILADVLFAENKRGRPQAQKRKWDILTLIQLAVDYNKVKEDMPGISDTKAARVIKERYRGRYKHASEEMIRQYFNPARDWLEKENRIRADFGMPPLTTTLTRPVVTVE